ncbi:transporter substrate-binding domain-containing protein [Halostella sp. JP-L12]|uniref:transporter substrate-binding domain-containing protein n=1 Tax=Halostella TaxID=1843185 RepID=UPI000EF81994|nr:MULTISPECIES: transporter substrate-binding domain-containing protein [Halostella]NHN47322.1 transporter substrate-binding domain-containing protein [Halostella sp. JP-L12]
MDRRTYLKTSAGTVAGLSLAGCLDSITGGGGDEEGDDNTITPATAPGFAPFEMKEDGELVGFDVDLLEAVVAETDYELGEWEEFEFDSLIPALVNDRVDVVAAAMTITEDRDENIDFSDPYYSANQAVLVQAGSDFQPSSLEDLAGRPIGAQKGTTGEGVVQSRIEDGTYEESDYNAYDNYVFAVEDLENGNIDAVVLDDPVANTFASNRDVEVSFVHETDEEYGFGVQDGASDVQSALNEGLQTVRDDGTYEELTNKWFASE